MRRHVGRCPAARRKIARAGRSCRSPARSAAIAARRRHASGHDSDPARRRGSRTETAHRPRTAIRNKRNFGQDRADHAHDRSAHTARAGYPRSRPRCSARRTAWRNTSRSCPAIRCEWRWWFAGSIRKASGTSKASSTSPALSVSAKPGFTRATSRQDAKAERGQIEVEIADRIDHAAARARSPPRPRAAPRRAAPRRSSSILPPGKEI